VLKNELNR